MAQSSRALGLLPDGLSDPLFFFFLTRTFFSYAWYNVKYQVVSGHRVRKSLLTWSPCIAWARVGALRALILLYQSPN